MKTSDPMSDERLAEIRADDCAMEITEVTDLLAEVERLREEMDAIRTDETDVDWLADHVRDTVQGISVRGIQSPERARDVIAEQAASLIRAGSSPFISARVVGLAVDHIRQAEAERDQLAEQVERLCGIEDAAVRAATAGHYTARQQLITDLASHGALTEDQTRIALRALDGTAADS